MSDRQNNAVKEGTTRRGVLLGAGSVAAAVGLHAASTQAAEPTDAKGSPQAAGQTADKVELVHKRATVNGIRLHYVTVGTGPVVLCIHGWPQSHREFLPIMGEFADRYTFIAPDVRGYGDSDKPFDGYEPKTIAKDMIELMDLEKVQKFHILSHDLGGPPSVAVAYLASDRALSLSTIETPFFGLDYPGYVSPDVAYWHLKMHMNMDISRMLIEGREEQYLRHFFRDFAYNPEAVSESEVQEFVMQMRQPGALRASLNHYGYIPQMAAQTGELTKKKLTVPMLAWAGSASFGSHCIDSAKAIATSARGGVIDECGHWVFEEKTQFICDELGGFWGSLN
ncbi:alpha/beta fold hydrolase [Candidatus Phyllobacterium onerii]|uniref:alpha/beta fold hydrolase n=1 Tax=Candidatus Phyllobacterium onerii TaxID=3020828 RepID=UPI002330E40F|nr:alpha/beta hydrolase [Phyllobacterium sp. IY22]